MTEMSIPVAGGSLYVEVLGPAGAPAVLYLHGGPGQGSYEFVQHQGSLLSAHLRVVALDQRGVLRSSPVPPDVSLTLEVLVDDCETVRQNLGIDRWAVLGQSFGGMVALLYAVRCPDAVGAVIFENPSWDISLTAPSVLDRIAVHADSLGLPELARRARTAAAGGDARTLWAALVRCVEELGDARDEIYVPDPDVRQHIRNLLAGAPFDAETWGRAGAHVQHITADPQFYASHLPLLAALSVPALLIKGGRDPIPSPAEVDAFNRSVPTGQTVTFGTAGHFVQAEQPDEYARLVAGFVRGHI